jgi:hypothetical protein
MPKDNEEVNAHMKRLQAMLNAATMVDPALDRDNKEWDPCLTTNRVSVGTQLAVSLHQRNVAEGKTEMTETCVTSSAAKMHVAG